MAGQADGSIIIDTELDNRGFKAGSAELLSAIKSLNNRANKLQKQMQTLGTQKFATDDYKQVQQDIALVEKDIDRFNQKRAKLSEKGKANTDEWKTLSADIKVANAELTRLKTLRSEMERSGTAYYSGVETEQYRVLNEALTAAKQSVTDLEARLSRVNSGKAFGSLLQKARQLAWTLSKTSVQKLVTGIKSATSSMARLVTQSKLMKKPLENMSFLLRRIAPSLLMTEGLFGLLRKAVNAFLQENEQLAANLNACWSGIGNILGPIITRLINLVGTAVAYVTSFLNLLGFVGKSTANAINKAGGAAKKETDKLKGQLASFDELNVLQDNEDSGGGGGNVQGIIPEVSLPDWAQLSAENLKAGKWKEAASVLTAELNRMVNSADWASVGTRMSRWINAVLDFGATAITTFDWRNLGAKFARMVNRLVSDVDWKSLGIVLGAKFTILFNGLGGLFEALDWSAVGTALSDGLTGLWDSIDWEQAGQTVSDGIIGVLNALTTAISNIDWQAVGNDIATFVRAIDWSGVFSALLAGIGAAFGGLGKAIWGIIEDAWNDVVKWWNEAAYEDGEFTIEGLFAGLWDSLCDVGSWVRDNIGAPFIESFQKVFGINSPSTVMKEQGGYITEGLLSGIKDGWQSLGDWVDSALKGLTSSLSSWANNATQQAKSQWYNIGSNICSGIGEGISAGWSWLKSKVQTLASNLLSSTKAALGIHSPSKLFRDAVGLNIGYGVGEGIEAAESSVIGSFAGLVNRMQGIANSTSFSVPSISSGNVVPHTAQAERTMRTTGETTVSNTGQIADSISEAVYAAVVEGLRQFDPSDRPIKVYLDGRQITASVEKRQRERGATIMRNGVYAY